MQYRIVFGLLAGILLFAGWNISQKMRVHRVGTEIFLDQCTLCHRLERGEPGINVHAKMILDTRPLSDAAVRDCIEERTHGLVRSQKEVLFQYLRAMELPPQKPSQRMPRMTSQNTGSFF